MKKPLVLIVEDDIWFAQFEAEQLEKSGYRTMRARDGIEAIRAVDQELPDAILLDLFLPGPNALVLLHEISSYSDLSRIPVVVCTASAGNLGEYDLAPYGVREILDKTTMKPVDLVAALRRVL